MMRCLKRLLWGDERDRRVIRVRHAKPQTYLQDLGRQQLAARTCSRVGLGSIVAQQQAAQHQMNMAMAAQQQGMLGQLGVLSSLGRGSSLLGSLGMGAIVPVERAWWK